MRCKVSPAPTPPSPLKPVRVADSSTVTGLKSKTDVQTITERVPNRGNDKGDRTEHYLRVYCWLFEMMKKKCHAIIMNSILTGAALPVAPREQPIIPRPEEPEQCLSPICISPPKRSWVIEVMIIVTLGKFLLHIYSDISPSCEFAQNITEL